MFIREIIINYLIQLITAESKMTAIDPLANPKGVVRLCELCQKPAYIQCSECRVTFYWSVVTLCCCSHRLSSLLSLLSSLLSLY